MGVLVGSHIELSIFGELSKLLDPPPILSRNIS